MSVNDRFSAKLMSSAHAQLGIVVLDLNLLLEKYSDNLPDHFKDDISDFIDEVLSFQDSLSIFASKVYMSEEA